MQNDKTRVLTEWIELYSASLLNRAGYLLSDKEEALDMVQEVFMAAHEAYEKYQRNSEPSTWLHGILHNKVADYYRRKYRRGQSISLEHFFDGGGSWKDNGVLHHWSDEKGNLCDDEDFNATFEHCLSNLPQRWKLPVKLYYLKEKKASEVCQEIGITKTNLWKILQRSRLQLRECLEKNWFKQL